MRWGRAGSPVEETPVAALLLILDILPLETSAHFPKSASQKQIKEAEDK